jgi:hypothetical protein
MGNSHLKTIRRIQHNTTLWPVACWFMGTALVTMGLLQIPEKLQGQYEEQWPIVVLVWVLAIPALVFMRRYSIAQEYASFPRAEWRAEWLNKLHQARSLTDAYHRLTPIDIVTSDHNFIRIVGLFRPQVLVSEDFMEHASAVTLAVTVYTRSIARQTTILDLFRYFHHFKWFCLCFAATIASSIPDLSIPLAGRLAIFAVAVMLGVFFMYSEIEKLEFVLDGMPFHTLKQAYKVFGYTNMVKAIREHTLYMFNDRSLMDEKLVRLDRIHVSFLNKTRLR